MSGFAAVFHLDGALVDRAWIEAMAEFLAFRGPDGREIWVSGSAGMCHVLLRTSAQSDGRAEIASLDGRLWIAGDARVDDRETLIAKLSSGSRDLRNATSAELIVHAYDLWGEACVEHLLGDFSFVIWDIHKRRVFAARDHLGVRPLFYSQVGQCLLISNTLDCIRRIPIVSDELNDRAIGDFLLVGQNQHPAETFFAAVQRLPVAHRLIAGPDGIRTERYWTLPIDEPLYYKRSGDYVERFNELLRTAVHDRLPHGTLGIFMSGGLDSPALAATAVQLGASVSAFTFVRGQSIPDQERHYSGLVAAHLRIPIFHHVWDDELWGWEPGSAPIHTPEPTEGNPLALESQRQYRREISTHARVFFWGDGPDAALLYEWRRHFNYLMRHGKWRRLCCDLALHVKAFRRVPLLPTLPRMWRERASNQPDWYTPSFPKWINSEFGRRLGLKQRWEQLHGVTGPSPHPVRRDAYACFACDFPMSWDTGNGGCPGDAAVEHLHPFWDIRLLRFLLAIPSVPWCREKYVIRSALKGVLPEAVRRRPKAPVPGFPYLERVRQSTKPSLPALSTLGEYVDMKALPEWPGHSRRDSDDELRVLCLHYWLLAR